MLRHWPFTTVGSIYLGSMMLLSIFQESAAQLPDGLLAPVIMPAYLIFVLVIMLTGIPFPVNLIVIIPALMALDVGFRAVVKRLFARRASVARGRPRPPATPS